MKHKLVLFVVLAAAVSSSGVALAGGSANSLGVGGEIQLNGLLGGVSANYDLGEFHVGGFLGFSDDGGDDDTDVALGGRFYYHVHSTAMCDFGLGGQLGVGLIGDREPGMDNDATVVFIEPGFQFRAFVVPNVALSFTGGVTVGLADAEGVALDADITGLAGAHYYFF